MARSVREALMNWRGDLIQVRNQVQVYNHGDETGEGFTAVEVSGEREVGVSGEREEEPSLPGFPEWPRVLEMMSRELSRASFETWMASRLNISPG